MDHSIDEFFMLENKAREEANKQVTVEQAEIKPGDFCIRHAQGFTIYCEILDPLTSILQGRQLEELDEEERAECEYLQASYQEENMRHYRFVRAYSIACPKGELGDIHISTVKNKISKEEFFAGINNL